jgi:hypothetical protein
MFFTYTEFGSINGVGRWLESAARRPPDEANYGRRFRAGSVYLQPQMVLDLDSRHARRLSLTACETSSHLVASMNFGGCGAGDKERDHVANVHTKTRSASRCRVYSHRRC